MAVLAPPQGSSPFAARRHAAALAAVVAAVLVLAAVVVHVQQRGGHRAALLQGSAAQDRRAAALRELGGERRVLETALRGAYINGFHAGEETAEKDVMEDERAQLRQREAPSFSDERQRLGRLRKALLDQSSAIARAQAERSMQENEWAEERRAMLLSERAADYARNWKQAALQETEAAGDEFSKEEAAARMQMKHAATNAGALAAPGSKGALELLDFCAQEFGEDAELQRFCYDKLISKSHGDNSVLQEPVKEAILREQVVNAPTVQLAMKKAESEGLTGPPQFAEMANGELYKVEPMKIALKPAMPVKQAARQRLAALAAAEKHADGKTNEVEVDGPTLAKSLAEAKSLGFKGHPKALVYHPAHGKPVVYNLEDKQAAAATMLAAAPTQAAKREVEVDANTLAGSIEHAHAMGLKGHPKAIVYHEANGKTEMYVDSSGQQTILAQRPSRAEVVQKGNGQVEVEAKSLKQSLAEARKMGFKGSPKEIVYHPAHGEPEIYKLQQK